MGSVRQHTQWKRHPPLCHLDRRSHGPSATQGDEKWVLFGSTLNGSATLPFVISTGEIMGLRSPKVMKNGFCWATTLNGSATLPFVISTGAPKERSGEICGCPDPERNWISCLALPVTTPANHQSQEPLQDIRGAQWIALRLLSSRSSTTDYRQPIQPPRCPADRMFKIEQSRRLVTSQ
jgi:hypothetical protein